MTIPRGTVLPAQRVRILYTNHRGSTAWRVIEPQSLYLGESPWHAGIQYLLLALDVEKNAPRDFAMCGIVAWQPADVQLAYQMKDLGFRRTPTDARLVVTFGDGSEWAAPAQLVADDRDQHHRRECEDTVGLIRKGFLSRNELVDWACSEMNWCDLEPWAQRAPTCPQKSDREGDYLNARKSILGAI